MLRINKNKRLIIGHINIISLRNKFKMLKYCIKGYADTLTTETKLDESFPNVQFQTDDFSTPHKRSTDKIRDGVVLFVWEDIPSELAKLKMRALNSFFQRN